MAGSAVPEQPDIDSVPLFDESQRDQDSAFRRVVPMLMDSYQRGKGRTLDPGQVEALAIGLLEMAGTIDMQIDLIGDLQRRVEELETKKRIWRPGG